MKKRIFQNMAVLASIVLMISAIGSFIIYYELMKKQIEAQMADEGLLVAQAIEMFESDEAKYEYMDKFDDEKELRKVS